MHAATVELLVKKARLEPDIALAFAQAMDLAMIDAQLVTVPILDSRLAELERRLDARFASIASSRRSVRRPGGLFVAFGGLRLKFPGQVLLNSPPTLKSTRCPFGW
jgi:hypothetical protein